MPSYNTGAFIKQSIDAVLKQTYSNWELIIVDDCSTDNTDDVVKSFEDKRIIYVKNKNNKGAAVSRNKAIKMAKGRFIAFLDSDDLWTKDKLFKQINFMLENDYAFTHTNYYHINEKSEPIGVFVTAPKVLAKYSFYLSCWAGCLTVIYDAEKLGKVQIENLKKRNDYAMWLKLNKKAKCYLLDENLAMYRRRCGSISNIKYSKLIKFHYLLFRKGEKLNPVLSGFLTGVNLFFGFYRKKVYRKIEKKG